MDVRYLLWRARFVVAGVCIAAAVGATGQALAPHYVRVDAVRMSHDIGPGEVLEADDLEEIRLPRAAVPDRSLTRERALGRSTLVALPRGSVLTSGLVRSFDALAADSSDRVLVTVELADVTAHLARPGARIAVFAPPGENETKATLLARDVRVLAVHEPSASLMREGATSADIAIDASVASVILARASATALLACTDSPALPATPTVLEDKNG